MNPKWPFVLFLVFIVSISCVQCRKNGGGEGRRNKKQDPQNSDEQDEEGLSLWINEEQLRVLSGFSIKIYAIQNGRVYTDLRDPNFNQYLPTIPSEVNSVNFTWQSGNKKYDYNFDRLKSTDESILKTPTVSIKTKGRIPHHEKDFSIFLPCTGNNSGTAMFSIGLLIQNRRGKPLPGTPLRLRFKKECAHRGVYDRTASNPLTSQQGPDPQCSLKCGNNGFCNHDICQCKAGYMGQYCQTALCYPQCMNGGNCTAPAVCSCPDGYQGRHCEGGICAEKCLNGGKCIQKDTCQCSKGYYGLHCEFSKCVVPCSNNGKCIGNNLCRCQDGTRGNHCEIGRIQRSTCKQRCRHGDCQNRKCKCKDGWHGKKCNSRKDKKPRRSKSKQ